MAQTQRTETGAPEVALWRTWGLRLIFLAIATILGAQQWGYILEEGTAEWSNWRGLGHLMLATLSVLAIAGIFHPLKLLPVMLYEIAWKFLWLMIIALPAWLDGRDVPTIVDVWSSAFGIVLVIILVPWRYVWWRYFAQPIEPWRRNQVLGE